MCRKVSIVIPTMNRADEVVDCINSIMHSSYNNFEIIVVDNASKDKTVQIINEKFNQNNRIKLIESEINLGAGGGRNRGAKESGGEYLLFIDSDNIIDPEMIGYLVEFFEKKSDCGMVGPLMLIKSDPNLIWLYFADINMCTSQAKYRGTGEKNNGQYEEIIEVGHLPNCFMVKRDDFEKVKGFDDKYIIMYEEADLAEKIKKELKKKIFVYSKAITYHDVPLPNKSLKENNFGFRTNDRAYLTARNRIYFMKKNASIFQIIIFISIFNPIILAFYIFNLLKNKEHAKALAYLKGSAEGIFM